MNFLTAGHRENCCASSACNTVSSRCIPSIVSGPSGHSLQFLKRMFFFEQHAAQTLPASSRASSLRTSNCTVAARRAGWRNVCILTRLLADAIQIRKRSHSLISRNKSAQVLHFSKFRGEVAVVRHENNSELRTQIPTGYTREGNPRNRFFNVFRPSGIGQRGHHLRRLVHQQIHAPLFRLHVARTSTRSFSESAFVPSSVTTRPFTRTCRSGSTAPRASAKHPRPRNNFCNLSCMNFSDGSNLFRTLRFSVDSASPRYLFLLSGGRRLCFRRFFIEFPAGIPSFVAANFFFDQFLSSAHPPAAANLQRVRSRRIDISSSVCVPMVMPASVPNASRASASTFQAWQLVQNRSSQAHQEIPSTTCTKSAAPSLLAARRRINLGRAKVEITPEEVTREFRKIRRRHRLLYAITASVSERKASKAAAEAANS